VIAGILMIFSVIVAVSRKWKFGTKKKSLLQGACRELSNSAATVEKREMQAGY